MWLSKLNFRAAQSLLLRSLLKILMLQRRPTLPPLKELRLVLPMEASSGAELKKEEEGDLLPSLLHHVAASTSLGHHPEPATAVKAENWFVSAERLM